MAKFVTAKQFIDGNIPVRKWTMEQLANYLGFSLREVKGNAQRRNVTVIQELRRLAGEVQTSRGGASFSDEFYRQLYPSKEEKSPIKIGEHISNNFYRVSDAVAGRLARDAGKPLPRHGVELSVDLPSGQHVWLTRTPTRYIPGYPKRGWVWAIYSSERIRF